MRHSNISFFVPHIGCPNCCTFCNQHTITSKQSPLTANEINNVCLEAINQVADPANSEIAFFGGSFTAIERAYMTELLIAASPFVGAGKFHGIRISTRPDCIDDEVLKILKEYGVTSIELGVQSMSDEVLSANKRGHSSNDVKIAVDKIREYGFELGLQMMTGLYKSTSEIDLYTAREIIKLSPDTVRIYPTVILNDTELADLYKNGEYKAMDFTDAVDLCAELLELFEINNIPVIRLGLHASEGVEDNLLGGVYHPAFKELCEGIIFRKRLEMLLNNKKNSTLVYVSPKSLSKAIGQKKSNINYFKEKGMNIIIKSDENLHGYEMKLG